VYSITITSTSNIVCEHNHISIFSNIYILHSNLSCFILFYKLYNIIIVNYIPVGKHIGLVKKSTFARVYIYHLLTYVNVQLLLTTMIKYCAKTTDLSTIVT